MADKIRVGIVGANAETGSWGTRAHIPALKALPDYELKAICTAHEDTAKRAAEAFGAELAFHDYEEMFANPDIDLVAVAVRVPTHYAITMAALKAGKDVYCEWPLGANLAEAQEMTDLARDKGVRSMIGLQARSDAAVCYTRSLVQDGYVGDVITAHMTMLTPGAHERTAARVWQVDSVAGANTFTIAGGHNIDALCFILGEFTEVSGKVITRIPQVRVTDKGEMRQATSPDNVAIIGILESGALASVHVAGVPFHGSGGWKLDIYGTEGTLTIAGGQANYSPTPLKVTGAKGKEPMAELPVPDEFFLVPEGTPDGAPFNVAQAYVRYADGVHSGQPVDPDFDLALRRHRMMAAMEQASTEGRTIKVQ